jgi:hypothetical protein
MHSRSQKLGGTKRLDGVNECENWKQEEILPARMQNVGRSDQLAPHGNTSQQ